MKGGKAERKDPDMRAAIVAASIALTSAVPVEPEVVEVDANVLVAVQAFVFMTSTEAFDGNRGGVYDAIQSLGKDFDRLYLETRGPVGDLEIEVQPGVNIKVRDYFDRVTNFANLAETT